MLFFRWWNARDNTVRLLGRISAGLCAVGTCFWCCAIGFGITFGIVWVSYATSGYGGTYYCVSSPCGPCPAEPLVVRRISDSRYNIGGEEVSVSSDGSFTINTTNIPNATVTGTLRNRYRKYSRAHTLITSVCAEWDCRPVPVRRLGQGACLKWVDYLHPCLQAAITHQVAAVFNTVLSRWRYHVDELVGPTAIPFLCVSLCLSLSLSLSDPVGWLLGTSVRRAQTQYNAATEPRRAQ